MVEHPPKSNLENAQEIIDTLYQGIQEALLQPVDTCVDMENKIYCEDYVPLTDRGTKFYKLVDGNREYSDIWNDKFTKDSSRKISREFTEKKSPIYQQLQQVLEYSNQKTEKFVNLKILLTELAEIYTEIKDTDKATIDNATKQLTSSASYQNQITPLAIMSTGEKITSEITSENVYENFMRAIFGLHKFITSNLLKNTNGLIDEIKHARDLVLTEQKNPTSTKGSDLSKVEPTLQTSGAAPTATDQDTGILSVQQPNNDLDNTEKTKSMERDGIQYWYKVLQENIINEANNENQPGSNNFIVDFRGKTATFTLNPARIQTLTERKNLQNTFLNPEKGSVERDGNWPADSITVERDGTLKLQEDGTWVVDKPMLVMGIQNSDGSGTSQKPSGPPPPPPGAEAVMNLPNGGNPPGGSSSAVERAKNPLLIEGEALKGLIQIVSLWRENTVQFELNYLYYEESLIMSDSSYQVPEGCMQCLKLLNYKPFLDAIEQKQTYFNLASEITEFNVFVTDFFEDYIDDDIDINSVKSIDLSGKSYASSYTKFIANTAQPETTDDAVPVFSGMHDDNNGSTKSNEAERDDCEAWKNETAQSDVESVEDFVVSFWKKVPETESLLEDERFLAYSGMYYLIALKITELQDRLVDIDSLGLNNEQLEIYKRIYDFYHTETEITSKDDIDKYQNDLRIIELNGEEQIDNFLNALYDLLYESKDMALTAADGLTGFGFDTVEVDDEIEVMISKLSRTDLAKANFREEFLGNISEANASDYVAALQTKIVGLEIQYPKPIESSLITVDSTDWATQVLPFVELLKSIKGKYKKPEPKPVKVKTPEEIDTDTKAKKDAKEKAERDLTTEITGIKSPGNFNRKLTEITNQYPYTLAQQQVENFDFSTVYGPYSAYSKLKKEISSSEEFLTVKSSDISLDANTRKAAAESELKLSALKKHLEKFEELLKLWPMPEFAIDRSDIISAIKSGTFNGRSIGIQFDPMVYGGNEGFYVGYSSLLHNLKKEKKDIKNSTTNFLKNNTENEALRGFYTRLMQVLEQLDARFKEDISVILSSDEFEKIQNIYNSNLGSISAYSNMLKNNMNLFLESYADLSVLSQTNPVTYQAEQITIQLISLRTELQSIQKENLYIYGKISERKIAQLVKLTFNLTVLKGISHNNKESSTKGYTDSIQSAIDEIATYVNQSMNDNANTTSNDALLLKSKEITLQSTIPTINADIEKIITKFETIDSRYDFATQLQSALVDAYTALLNNEKPHTILQSTNVGGRYENIAVTMDLDFFKKLTEFTPKIPGLIGDTDKLGTHNLLKIPELVAKYDICLSRVAPSLSENNYKIMRDLFDPLDDGSTIVLPATAAQEENLQLTETFLDQLENQNLKYTTLSSAEIKLRKFFEEKNNKLINKLKEMENILESKDKYEIGYTGGFMSQGERGDYLLEIKRIDSSIVKPSFGSNKIKLSDYLKGGTEKALSVIAQDSRVDKAYLAIMLISYTEQQKPYVLPILKSSAEKLPNLFSRAATKMKNLLIKKK